jgi:hypothetical protein
VGGDELGAVGRREHERVGAVGHDECAAGGCAGFHEEAEGGDVGVGAAGDGLDVENENIHLLQDGGGGGSGVAVEGENGDIPVGVGGVGDVFARTATAPEAVFGAEKGGEGDAGVPQVLRGVAASGGDAGGMGHQADASAGQPVEGDVLDAGNGMDR